MECLRSTLVSIKASRGSRYVVALAREVFCADRRLEIMVLSGGGVPNVLLADFCRMYGLGIGGAPLPQLVVVPGECGRSSSCPHDPAAPPQSSARVGARI